MSRKTEKFTYTDGQYFCNICDEPHEGEELAVDCYDACLDGAKPEKRDDRMSERISVKDSTKMEPALESREAVKTYTIIEVPADCEDETPYSYEEVGFVRWVDEVFLEGYKKGNDAPFPTPNECLNILRAAGYVVEVEE